MKKLTVFLILFYFITASAFAQTSYTNPGITLADPYVFFENGMYYAYGTTSSDGFLCWTSVDLVNWTSEGYAYQETPSTWGDDTYWAPEVKAFNGKYYMSYSCRGKGGANEGRMLLCLAVSDSPTGPFTDLYAPWFDEGYSCIDSDIFFDDDATPYLYFDKVGASGYIYGLVYVRQLSGTDLTITGDAVQCIQASQPWENPNSSVNRTNEGSFVFRYQDTYFMTYSANSWDNPYYGIGYATAASPLGPWTKSVDNPIIHRDESIGIYGPGHNSITTSPDGKEKFIVYHTHVSSTNTSRKMNIDRLYIDDNLELQVLGPTRSPQPLPSGVISTLVNVNSVSLDHESADLVAGTTLQLGFDVSPEDATIKNVLWKSSNPSVASVTADGLVKAVSPGGNCKIFAISYEGNKKDTCDISVSGINVNAVLLDHDSLVIINGKTQQLTAAVLPIDASYQELNWSSSNINIADVSSSGLVTAKGIGMTKLFVVSLDGGKKDSCVVTVNSSAIYVSSVLLNKHETSIVTGNSEQLTATVFPENATNPKVKWRSTNTSIARVSLSGLVDAISPGESKVIVTTVSNNRSDTCEVTVTDHIDFIHEHDIPMLFYPNPASDYIHLENLEGHGQICMISLLGTFRKVLVYHSDKVIINLADYPKGFYIIQVITEKGIETAKLLIE